MSQDEMAADAEQALLWQVLKTTDPTPAPDTLYDTWASALYEAGVRAPGVKA